MTWRLPVIVAVVVATLAAPTAAVGVTPANDDFAGATDLGPILPTAVSGTTVEATAEPGEPDHGPTAPTHSVWYRWTPSAGVQVGFNACDADHRPEVRVYTGSSVNALSEALSSQVGTQCMRRLNAQAGTTYSIVVNRENTPGDFRLALRDLSTAPPNDDFEDAAILDPQLPDTAAGDTINATEQENEPVHDEADVDSNSLWYRWTAQATGPVKIDTCVVPAIRYAVYTGSSLGTLQSVAPYEFFVCARTFYVIAGTTYSIAFDDDIGDLGFGFTLRAAHPPPNDDFDAGIELPPYGPVIFDDDNYDATAEPGEPAHPPIHPARKSVWYRWTAPEGAEVTVSCAGDASPRLGVYVGDSLDDLEPAPASGQAECARRFAATAGTTYHFAVDTMEGQGAEGTFSFRLIGPSLPPPNDDFERAQPIGPSLPAHAEGDIYGATPQPGEPFPLPELEPFYSAWYSWTPPSTGPVELDTCDSDFDSILAVYTGSELGSLSSIQANDDGEACFFAENEYGSAVAFNATAGTTYRISVDGFEEGFFALSLRATGPHTVPVPPAARRCPKGKKLKRGKCVRKKKKKAKKRRSKSRAS